MRKLSLKARWLVAYCLSRAGVFLGRCIPTRLAYAMANPIADVCYLVMRRHRRGLLANLEPVVGPEAAPATGRRVFRNFARYVIDFYQQPSRGRQTLRRRIDFDQWDELDEALSEGNGVIFVTLHLGQAELGAGALATYDHNVSVITEKLSFGPMDCFIQDLRRKLGMKPIPAKSTHPGVLRCLSRGEILGLMFDAVDQGTGVTAEFFGRSAEFSSTPARIAVRTGARVLPAVVARDPEDPTRLLPVIDFSLRFQPSGEKQSDVYALTQAIARSFEAMVARFPDQWIAFKPVWRDTSEETVERSKTAPWMQLSLAVANRLGGVLPRKAAYACARLAGDLAYRFRHQTRADVFDNLRHVLGEGASSDEVERHAREVFRNVARYYVDLIRLPKLTPRRILEQEVRISGLERLTEPVSRGQGVVVATAHLGNPEMAVQVGSLLGFDLLVLAEPLNPPAFARIMERLRSTYGARYQNVSFSAVSGAIRHLKGGGVLAITCDRDIQGAGAPLPFFGDVTQMPLGAVEFATRTGASLVPGFCIRTGSTFEIVFEEPIELVDTGNPKDDVLTNAETLIRRAEDWIRRYPGQWMVLERIWKEPRPQKRPRGGRRISVAGTNGDRGDGTSPEPLPSEAGIQ